MLNVLFCYTSSFDLSL
uniref:Uncharacterized protein n=1 Tax=Anguilla anguilla TaxID=7936 RepID=A0A0E9XVY5_ANGAN